MAEETTIRLALARRKMNLADLTRASGVSWETISKTLDDIPDGVNTSTLRKLAEALGLRLVIRFEEVKEEMSHGG